MAFEIELERRYIEETPQEMEARRQRVIAILRKYRHYLLTPAPPSPKMEEVTTEKGEGK